MNWTELVILFLLIFFGLSASEASGLVGSDVDWGYRSIDRHRALLNTDVHVEPVVVAVIDTGIDATHPALKNQLWLNGGEAGRDRNGNDKSKNGIDDDQNGYIDDVHGWNFAGSNNDISDRHGHGTHVAGIIAAEDSRKLGMQGIAPFVKLMVLKYYDASGTTGMNLQSTVSAIQYATKMGAHIINYSSGGPDRSLLEEFAIREAAQKNILFVAASGNDGTNIDTRPYYPAKYNLPNMISVTAYDPEYRVLASSNTGIKTVDIAAPGQAIISTMPGGQYGAMTGTSQATAFVTGVAALISRKFPDLRKPDKLIQHLVASGSSDPQLTNKTKYRVRVNANKALVMYQAEQDLVGRIPSEVQRPSLLDYF